MKPIFCLVKKHFKMRLILRVAYRIYVSDIMNEKLFNLSTVLNLFKKRVSFINKMENI